MRFFWVVVISLVGNSIWASCTPTAVTVCYTVSYKQGQKVTECETKYEWTCEDSSGGGNGGSNGSGGSSGGSGTGSGTGSSASFPNANQITDCMEKIVDYESILSEFGETDQRQVAHTGLDLKVGNGTSLMSPVNGVVFSVKNDYPTDQNVLRNEAFFAGNQIVIDIDGSEENMSKIPGRVTRIILDHLNPDIVVRKGDLVSIGDMLGTTDNTGNTRSGPHLHIGFQTYTGTSMEDIDPRLFLINERCN